MSDHKIHPTSAVATTPIEKMEDTYEYPSKKEMERIVKRSYGEKSLPVGPLFDTEEKYMKELKFRYRRADM